MYKRNHRNKKIEDKCRLHERGIECQLTHCVCNTHDFKNFHHECYNLHDIENPFDDYEILRAERKAGWDPNP